MPIKTPTAYNPRTIKENDIQISSESLVLVNYDPNKTLLEKESKIVNGDNLTEVVTKLNYKLNNSSGGTISGDIDKKIEDKINELLDDAPKAIETLKEITEALGGESGSVTNIVNILGDKLGKDDTAKNSEKVNGLTVETAVPKDAVFTDTTYDLVTHEKDGLMSKEDKIKLDNMSENSSSGEESSAPVNKDKISEALGYEPVSEEKVEDIVKNCIGSAPDTLDTLNELANALNNDPNFSTTITNLIGEKLGKNETAANAKKVNGLTVETAVPKNAKFTDTVYTLPNASSSVLGGVKIGNNITCNSGTIGITKSNVNSALGLGVYDNVATQAWVKDQVNSGDKYLKILNDKQWYNKTFRGMEKAVNGAVGDKNKLFLHGNKYYITFSYDGLKNYLDLYDNNTKVLINKLLVNTDASAKDRYNNYLLVKVNENVAWLFYYNDKDAWIQTDYTFVKPITPYGAESLKPIYIDDATNTLKAGTTVAIYAANDGSTNDYTKIFINSINPNILNMITYTKTYAGYSIVKDPDYKGKKGFYVTTEAASVVSYKINPLNGNITNINPANSEGSRPAIAMGTMHNFGYNYDTDKYSYVPKSKTSTDLKYYLIPSYDISISGNTISLEAKINQVQLAPFITGVAEVYNSAADPDVTKVNTYEFRFSGSDNMQYLRKIYNGLFTVTNINEYYTNRSIADKSGTNKIVEDGDLLERLKAEPYIVTNIIYIEKEPYLLVLDDRVVSNKTNKKLYYNTAYQTSNNYFDAYQTGNGGGWYMDNYSIGTKYKEELFFYEKITMTYRDDWFDYYFDIYKMDPVTNKFVYCGKISELVI